jgi:hypothetical protein
MSIKPCTSYNIVFDDNSDNGSGNLAYLLSQTIFKLNLDKGLERGLPFLADQGIVISNDELPARNLVVLSLNKHNAESTDLILQQDIADIIHFMLAYNNGVTCDIRKIKAICKTYKKTQSYRKYLHCLMVLAINLDTEVADKYIKDLLSYGLPFYVKVKETIRLLVNLNQSHLRKLLFYRNVWGEDTLNSIFLYLTGDNPLPEYITNEFKEDMAGNLYKINLINLGIALGKGQLNKMILKLILDTEE